MAELQSSNWAKLTDKQRAFIEEYLQSFNTVQSYIKAGYSTNCKPATLNKNAYMLLKSESIQLALNELLETVKEDKDHIASKVEKFLMKTLEDENVHMKDRLKSAEMLAKMAGVFDYCASRKLRLAFFIIKSLTFLEV